MPNRITHALIKTKTVDVTFNKPSPISPGSGSHFGVISLNCGSAYQLTYIATLPPMQDNAIRVPNIITERLIHGTFGFVY